MKTIYIAGKYTGKNYNEVQENIERAESAALKLLEKGWNVFIPHKNFSHFENKIDFKQTDWMKRCIIFLNKFDAIFMLDDWKDSEGAMEEYNHASAINLSIYLEEDGYPNEKEN